MKLIAINGSPRKNGNTATLLARALAGAAAQGAETEMIQLYDLNYKGCISCFACKLKNGKSYGCCAYQDELTPLLEKIRQSDALLFGSPVYFGAETGAMRSFLERLLFPYLVYDGFYSSLFPKQIATGFIYTMNVDEQRMKEMEYEKRFALTEWALKRTFGAAESLLVNDTHQFTDYANYVADGFDAAKKAKRRAKVFPQDCERAYELGGRLANGID
ncbi:flavodoxin family protein [Azotosporobacter soli]|uniref:flavodoxin family protein n=1 Tax=Azotosporobacter soli TaxID=3055040 RepID=UPI0031FE6C63